MGGSIQKVFALAKSFLDQRIPAMTSPVRKKKWMIEKIQKSAIWQDGKTHWL
jgi:hypothetical protein